MMPVDLPPEREALVLGAAGAAGALGRYLGWVRSSQHKPLGRWTFFFQLPVGCALGVATGMAAIAIGIGDFWQVMLVAQVAGILGPDAVDMLIEAGRGRLGGKPPA
jgi:hypothetical protein